MKRRSSNNEGLLFFRFVKRVRQCQIPDVMKTASRRREHWIWYVFIGVCALRLGFAPLARAQFALPSGPPSAEPMMCRPVPVKPEDSAAFVFEYLEGDSARQRLTLVAFDSVGGPLHLMMSSTSTTIGDSLRVDLYGVQFFPTQQGGRLVISRTPEDSKSPIKGGTENGQTSEQSLTQAQITDAKKLAEWFWSHRCKLPP